MLNSKITMALDEFITGKIDEVAGYFNGEALEEFDEALVGMGEEFALSEEDIDELVGIFEHVSVQLTEAAENIMLGGE